MRLGRQHFIQASTPTAKPTSVSLLQLLLRECKHADCSPVYKRTEHLASAHAHAYSATHYAHLTIKMASVHTCARRQGVAMSSRDSASIHPLLQP